MNKFIFSMAVYCLLGLVHNGVEGNCDVEKCKKFANMDGPPPSCDEMENILNCFKDCTYDEAPIKGQLEAAKNALCPAKKNENLVKKNFMCQAYIDAWSEGLTDDDCKNLMTMEMMLEEFKEEKCSSNVYEEIAQLEKNIEKCSSECTMSTFMKCYEPMANDDSDEEMSPEEECPLFDSFTKCMGDCTPDKFDDEEISSALTEMSVMMETMCGGSSGSCTEKCSTMADFTSKEAPPCSVMAEVKACYEKCGDAGANMVNMIENAENMKNCNQSMVKRIQNVLHKIKNRE